MKGFERVGRMKKNKKPKVIYIAGSSFTGSTLLDLVLGSDDSVISTGESALLRNYIYGLDARGRKNANTENCMCKKKNN